MTGATATTATPATFTGSVSPYYSLTGLTPGVTYYFLVAVISGGIEEYGSWLSFTTTGPPTLTSPANNAVVDAAAGFTASWTDNLGSGGAQTGYAFAVTVMGVESWWTGSGWTSSETYVTSTATSVTFGAGAFIASDTGLTYDWAVSVKTAAGVTGYCSPFALIAEGAPFAPTLLSPANGAYADPANQPITFQVAANPNGTANPTGYIFKQTTGGVTNYWNSSTQQFQSTSHVNPWGS
jgi:hypothetical protein